MVEKGPELSYLEEEQNQNFEHSESVDNIQDLKSQLEGLKDSLESQEDSKERKELADLYNDVVDTIESGEKVDSQKFEQLKERYDNQLEKLKEENKSDLDKLKSEISSTSDVVIDSPEKQQNVSDKGRKISSKNISSELEEISKGNGFVAKIADFFRKRV